MKTVLITGSTGAIGNAVVKHLSNQPVRLIACARNQVSLAKLQASLPAKKADIIVCPFDYNDKASYLEVIDQCEEKLDGLLLSPPRIEKSTECMPDEAEWIDNFRQAFVLPLEFLKSLLPLLKCAKRAKIVVLSGISSKTLLSNYAVNGAIRAAWSAQIKAMAFEYGADNIHINALSLGGVMTPKFVDQVQQEASHQSISVDAVLAYKTGNVPLHKYASLEEIAEVVEAMLGNFTNHITGSNIICDGGFIRAY